MKAMTRVAAVFCLAFLVGCDDGEQQSPVVVISDVADVADVALDAGVADAWLERSDECPYNKLGPCDDICPGEKLSPWPEDAPEYMICRPSYCRCEL